MGSRALSRSRYTHEASPSIMIRAYPLLGLVSVSSSHVVAPRADTV